MRRLAATSLMLAALALPAQATPVLLALNEQPKCMAEVEHSAVLHLKGMRKVGASSVRLTIKQNKAVKAKPADFRVAKKAFVACMTRRLEAQSVSVE